MIAAFRSGIGFLVDQWSGGSRARTGQRLIKDRQGSRAPPRSVSSADVSAWLGTHAGVAMRRFTAHTLDANLGDLRDVTGIRRLNLLRFIQEQGCMFR